MATVRDIVERAYRKLGVVSLDEPMDADQADAGLKSFNEMLHGWALFGIDVEHSDVALNDAFPLADRFQEGTIYTLAQRIAPEFSTGFDGDTFLRALQAAYMVIDTAEMPSSLIFPPSRRLRFWP